MSRDKVFIKNVVRRQMARSQNLHTAGAAASSAGAYMYTPLHTQYIYIMYAHA
jgi:hypothetical protein